ncbi:DNA polymerase delta subunit 2 isoform X3 [Folsomia candida]|uniref:DNA polymerase delta subunit 2 isoform X3 n=1 Tax=Folsomia candida TaxID=158441 RepID=UPI000B8F9896|nr:DNA polymerase delta subunit 2 isoform X3 [Folsomia candida]
MELGGEGGEILNKKCNKSNKSINHVEDIQQDAQEKGEKDNKSKLFDTFDWETMSVSEQDFSAYLNTNNNVPPQVVKPVVISETVHTHSIADFVACGPTARPPRKNRSRSKQLLAQNVSSRRLRTFQARLERFRPCLKGQIASLQEWNQVKLVEDIYSISSMGLNTSQSDDTAGDAVEIEYDQIQGVGFRRFEESIVIIGYIFKVTPASLTTKEKLCAEIGVYNIPLKPVIEPCLFLEDATAKIRLRLTRQTDRKRFTLSQIVSGIPVAIKGICAEGMLWVEDVLFVTHPSPPIPLSCITNEVDMVWSKYIYVFVSGINIGMRYTNWAALDSLFDYLQGLSGSELEHESILRRSTRVFFIGNSFPKRKRWDPDRREEMTAANCSIADKLDYYLTGLTNTTEVFIVPGENDPTHKMTLPQPPLHKQLFPNAMQRATFRCLTNPAKVYLGISDTSGKSEHHFDENIMNLVLSSGLNVKETMNNCEISCPLEMCVHLLKWSHLYPASTDDGEIAEELFSLSQLPHLFVVGGLSCFKVKKWNGVKIVSVPPFWSTGTVITMHKNGAITPIHFKVS